MLTTDNIAYDTDDIPSPAENNNKVVVTNDYGLVDYSFIEPYTTSVYDSDANTSIVVTSGTSGRIDNSLLNTTNSSTNGANKVVITDDSGLINYNLIKASVTPLANYIPVSNSSNKLDNNWLNNVVSSSGSSDRSKFVLTNANGKINNNLLNASTTASASSLPLSDSNGKISDTWLTTTTTSAPDTIVKLDGTGKLDASLIKTGLFIPMTGGEPSGNIIIQGSGSQINRTLADLKAKYPNFYGFGSNSYSDGFLIGMNGSSDTDNYLVVATHDNGNEPIIFRQYKGTTGYNNMEDNVNHEVTLMDKDGYTSVLKLTSANDIISTNGGLSVNSNITSTNGNLSIAGTSTLTGNVTAKGTLSVTGAITNGSTITSAGLITANGGVKTTTLEASGAATLKSTLSVTGTSTLTGAVTASSSLTTTGLLTANGGVVISGSGDKINTSSDTSALLRIGSINGNHLSLDEDEISSRSNSTTGKRSLYLQPDGGGVIIGQNIGQDEDANFYVKGQITGDSLWIYEPTRTRRRAVIVASTLNGDGDNIYYTGGGNLTGVFGGDSYSTWWNYVKDGTSNDYWSGDINSTYYDAVYIMSDHSIHLQTYIQNGYENRKDFVFSDSGDISAPRNITAGGTVSGNSLSSSTTITATGKITSGSLATGPLETTTITATGNITATGKTVTAGNFAGKWSGYTQDIGTAPTVNGNTWILLNNNANIQHTTISSIGSVVKDSFNGKITGSSLATNGYVKYDNGLLIQWGKSTFDGELEKTVTVVTAAPFTQIFAVYATDKDTTNVSSPPSASIAWMTHSSKPGDNKTTITFGSDTTSTHQFVWMAIGKWN